MSELPKAYNPAEHEQAIYRRWEESGFFNPDNLPERHKEAFCTLMPPPNANGRLHAGHALDMTLKDIVTRFKRMQGYRALFVPGADHAGFETQIVYEKKLEKEGRSRFQMEPQDLYNEILQFTLENKKFMEDDVRRLGTSCDWSREKFTLDPDVVTTVHQTFKRLFEDGLVYRGKRIVNWCAKHQTSLSDLETEFVEKNDPFYYFQYGPFVIGTARPETKFGDKYVVMHPDDPRYSEYTDGQTIELEWITGPITATVIKDEAIDREFGSGVMTITPWHDQVDFDIAERHDLDREQIIDNRGKLLPIAGEFAGMKVAEARPKIVEKLREKGLLVKVDENYRHSVRVCYKCATPIEPQILNQWFVRMQPLAQLALDAVERDGKVTMLPEYMMKTFLYWMHNPIDWNISRQIIWGIPIPAKLCTSCGHGFPDLENTSTTCPQCGGGVVADTDTFDTWFSSGQWPLVTLGWPDHADFATYYPTQIMETGRELVFKWVPRMIFFGMYLAGDIPFRDVYFHGMVLDGKGQKMSKSKGNVISPIDVADQYGVDALRMALVIGNTPGTDFALSPDKIRGQQHFANKLWNISRFALMHLADYVPSSADLNEADQQLLHEVETLIADTTADITAYRFHLASERLYHYVWHTLADKILESLKVRLSPEAEAADRRSAQYVLAMILPVVLKLLHPFMPFVTEVLWGHLPAALKDHEMLMVASWPEMKNPKSEARNSKQ